jgi:hypothetical protein
MTNGKQPNNRWRPFLTIFLLTTFVLILTIEVGLRLFYPLIPPSVCPSAPIVGNYYCQPHFQYDKPIRLAYWYKPGLELGGMFDPAALRHNSDPAAIAPSERDDTFEYQLTIDEMGFPNGTAEWQSQYDLVIVGDSFTLPSSPRRWIDLLAEETGRSILTLGAPSWSTPNEVEAAKQFGLDKEPDWLILLYFEGNDLFNVAQYQERQASSLSWQEYDFQKVPFYYRSLSFHLLRSLIVNDRPSEMQKAYRYPIQAQTDIGPIDLVLEDLLLLPLSADYQTLAGSDEFTRVKDDLLSLHQLTRDQETRLLLVYVPTKAHVYWPRIWEAEDTSVVLERTVTVTLSEGDHGRLQWQPPYLDYETFSRNQNAQAELIGDFSRENGIEFLDLTPDFHSTAVVEGELYNYVDSHFNQAGNNLLAELVGNYLAENE